MGEDIVRSLWRHRGQRKHFGLKTSDTMTFKIIYLDEVLTRTNGVMIWVLSQRRAR
jgi:hypothetical protein